MVEIVGRVSDVEIVAEGSGIRDLARLRRHYGPGNWRKLKGTAQVQLPSGQLRWAEIHWYEAHGIGKREFKIKRFQD
jgi:hypothetical protein